jgi:hypothetical protein
MAYTASTLDDNTPADERDIPQTMRRYTCDYAGETVRTWRLPLDVKVCTLVNGTDKTLEFYVAKYNGTDYSPLTSDLHDAGTSSRIETVAAGATFPIAQHDEWNTLFFKAGSAATGTVTLRPGMGRANGIVTAETRALTAV